MRRRPRGFYSRGEGMTATCDQECAGPCGGMIRAGQKIAKTSRGNVHVGCGKGE